MSEFNVGYILLESERITIWAEGCSSMPEEAKKYYNIAFNVQQGVQFLCYTDKGTEVIPGKERLVKKMWNATSHFYTIKDSVVMFDLESNHYQVSKKTFPNVTIKKDSNFDEEVKEAKILNTEKNKYEYFKVIKKEKGHSIEINNKDIEIVEKITIPPHVQIRIIEERKIK